MLPLKQMLTAEKLMADKAILGTMNLFGVLVYTEEHPYIAMMLRNKDFWRSLNSRTRGWILYSVRPEDDYMHLTEEYLLPQLGIQRSEDLPQLVILAMTPEGTILQQNFPIDDSNVDNAYHSLENTVGIVSDALKKIIPSERNGINVHREVVASLRSELAKCHWKRVSSEFARFVFGLLGIGG